MAGTISFDGLATGINTTETVDKLIEVESRPKILKEAEKVRLENQLQSWQEINTRLLSVKVAASDLSRLATWNSQAVSSSDETILTATAALGAPEGTYTLTVDQLAKAHQVATPANPGGGDDGYASAGSLFGTGDLKITVGGVETTITLDVTNNTLSGVAQAVNDADLGATASVVYNGAGYQLLLASNETGEENVISVDATGVDTTGTRALDTWTTVQAAQDAQVSLGSGAGKISVSSASNTVDTLLQGITLRLHAEAAGTEATISVSRDTGELTDKVQTFVEAYNKAANYISEQFAYDADQNVAGILMGDSTLLGIQRTLNNLMLHTVSAGSQYGALSSVGITVGADGTLALDSAEFASALVDDFEGVMRLFRNGGESAHSQISYVYAAAETAEGEYLVDVTAPATQASVAGTAPPTLTIADDNDELTLSIDGGPQFAVSLKHDTYATAQDLATEIQNQINQEITGSVTVSVNADGYLTITSDRYGSTSSVWVLGGDAVTNPGPDGTLGLALATATGADVEGTIGGEPATGTGQILKGDAGNEKTDGLQVLVELDAPGAATLTVTKGVFSLFDEYLSGLTDPFTGAVGLRETSLNTSIDNIQARIEEMEERLEVKRESLFAQFIQMEKVVSEFNSQGNYLTNALSGLSNNWKWNS